MITSPHVVIAGLCTLGLTCAAAASTVYYVDASAGGIHDGSTWENAFVDLNDALDATAGKACCAGDGCEIWVAAGTYVPDRGTGNRSNTFKLNSCVGIYGGFDSTETRRDQRDWLAHVTVLSGDIAGDDIPELATGLGCFTIDDVDAPAGCARFDVNGDDVVDRADLGTTENSYVVVQAVNVDHTAALDGLTITGGSGEYTDGAGLTVILSDPTVRHCRFIANYDGRNGGAVRIAGASQPLIDRCAFIGNRSGFNRGGAIAVENDGDLTLVDSTFQGNWGNDGGALYIGQSTATVINCSFLGNHSTWSWGGALSTCEAPDLQLVNCAFSGNTSNSGGAINNADSTMTMTHCTVVNNRIGALNFAGGVRQIDGTLAIHNSILWGNIDSGGIDETAQLTMTGGTPTVTYSSSRRAPPCAAPARATPRPIRCCATRSDRMLPRAPPTMTCARAPARRPSTVATTPRSRATRPISTAMATSTNRSPSTSTATRASSTTRIRPTAAPAGPRWSTAVRTKRNWHPRWHWWPASHPTGPSTPGNRRAPTAAPRRAGRSSS